MSNLEARIIRLEQQLMQLSRDLQNVEDVAGNAQQQVGLLSSGGFDDSGSGSIQPAVLTATLLSGSLASPTSASATTYQANVGSPGFVSGTSDTIYNTWPLSSSLASGTQVYYVEISGYKYMVTAACS